MSLRFCPRGELGKKDPNISNAWSLVRRKNPPVKRGHMTHNNLSPETSGAGTLHLGAKSVADMAKSLHVTNAQNHLEVLRGLGMYLKLFLGTLWQTYI